MATCIGVDRLLSREEVAEMLGIKTHTLAVWATTGRHGLKFIRVGGNRVRYRLSDVEEWLAAHTATCTSAARAAD